MIDPIVFRSKNIKAVAASPDGTYSGPVRLVTFESIAGPKRGNSKTLFGGPLVQKFGIDIIHVVPRSINWYQYPEMAECLAAIRARITPNAIAYGSSMGGYAVAHFIDQIGTDRGICISPQISIQREVVPFESRWGEHAAATTFLTNDKLSPRRGKLWLFVDPSHDRDVAHTTAIAAAGPHEIVEVAYGGHAVARTLAGSGSLSRIVEMFLNDAEDPKLFSEIIASNSDRSQRVLVNRARTVDDDAQREDLLRQALAMKPNDRKAVITLGKFLMRSGRVEEGKELFRPLISKSTNTKLIEKYRKICRTVGSVPDL